MPPHATTGPFRILVVCTANQCRSPLAEFTLRRLIQSAELPWSVSSAGTLAQPGWPPHPGVQRLLAKHGDQFAGWRSRTLDLGLLEADLILVADLENRNRVIRASPGAAPRTFLLLQLAVFCERRRTGLRHVEDRPGAVREWVAEVRGTSPRTQLDADLADPVGRSFKRFQQLDTTVTEAARQIVGSHATIKR